jgi:hypothetical protein
MYKSLPDKIIVRTLYHEYGNMRQSSDNIQ